MVKKLLMALSILAVTFTLSAVPAAAETLKVVLELDKASGEVVSVGVFTPTPTTNHPNRGDKRHIKGVVDEPTGKPVTDLGGGIELQLQHQNPYWIKIGNRWYKIG